MMTTKEARTFLREVLNTEVETLASGQLRQRCRACRKYFGFSVYRGRFCSPECAGIGPEFWRATELVEASDRNYCQGCRGSHGRAKKIYLDDGQARHDADRLSAEWHIQFEVYTCREGNCHVGRRPRERKDA